MKKSTDPLLLLVDDNTVNIKVLASMLRERGYKTAVATSGPEALTFVEKRLPDLILLDIMMPEMDGYTVCRQLKHSDRTKEIPVIFLSALSETADKVKGFEAGGVDYITKPFQQEEVVARVRNHLTIAHQTSEIKQQHAFLQSLIDMMPNPFFYKDNTGEFLGCNRSFEEMTGISRNSIIGKKSLELSSDPAQDTLHEKIDQELLSHPGMVKYETKITAADNDIHDAIVYKSTFPSPEGTTAGLIGLIADITELKRQEAKLKTSEQQIREINRKLEELVRIDPLTGIANRRHFEEVFIREWRRAVRYSDYISVLMIDIDHFKLYNDNYGHPRGDECLKCVAKIISDSLHRATDLAARYGGEEFIVVLPHTDEPGTMTIAQNIRKKLAEAALPHKATSCGCKQVTVSIGAATLIPKKQIAPETLIKQADEALYISKNSGRDTITTFQRTATP